MNRVKIILDKQLLAIRKNNYFEFIKVYQQRYLQEKARMEYKKNRKQNHGMLTN